MGAELFPIVLVGGAIAYVELAKPAQLVPPNQVSINGSTLVSGASPGTPIPTVVKNGNTTQVGLSNGQLAIFHSVQANLARPPNGGTPSLAPDPFFAQAGTGLATEPPWNSVGLNQKLNAVDAYAGAAYTALGDDAKSAGAQALNQALNLSPPLTGKEDYKTVITIVASAAGSAAGAALGGAIAGPVGAYLGSVVGAYLGKNLADLINQNIDQLTSWCSGQLASLGKALDAAGNLIDGAGDKLEGAYDSAASTASDAYNDVSNYLGGDGT